ncbi:hypothetical protein DBR23_26030 [Acidovorax sp. HMWF018]|uniref:hypothetical protein n=1 Tax=unclassified Acidovorax TaxID=2684926 RepID=UPI000D34C34C|nr:MULTISPECIES: hypothetical protein [unclassified Acidovorax]NCU66760.1 hypothetical protein [Acidovorax sp. 210-6]PTT34527.1 hypothetical protein DBR23_26030 [Acidovorax sp. HMWF018]
MTTYLTAMAIAVAVRDLCIHCASKGRPIEGLYLDSVVAQTMRDTAALLPCPDDVFQGIAGAIVAQNHCTATEAFEQVLRMLDTSRSPGYSRWRHGGWYVHGVRYPSGACGCISSNYPDKKWRIVCDRRRQDLNAPGDVTFRSREEAARAEQVLALQAWVEMVRSPADEGREHP